jgi:hypothetical protein
MADLTSAAAIGDQRFETAQTGLRYGRLSDACFVPSHGRPDISIAFNS